MRKSTRPQACLSQNTNMPKFELRADEFEYNLKKTLQRDIEKFRYRSISAAQKLLHF